MSDPAPRKFRVWDGEEMHEVPHGWYLDASGVLYRYRYDGTLFADLDDDRWVILQYTGITDAEGTEIYEGDVVEDENGTRWVVEWDEDHGMFNFQTYEGLGDWAYIASLDTTVIGNRYENPELLE